MAAPCGHANDSQYSVEIHFAQRLASNEKKIRDRAVKRLRHWIAARSQKDGNISSVELMKLWKGLFYCMWMSDKPVIQEELADQISDMAHCFRRPQEACLFFETFLATMRREWIGIDHLRMDKYLMLIRRSFRQMLVVLHNNEWDEELVETFLNSLRQCALNPEIDACPDGLRYQLANVYLDELAREGTEDLSPQLASTFLSPFAELVAKTLNKKLRDVILQDIFQDVVERSDVGEKEEEEEEEDEGIASDEDRKKSSKHALKERRTKKRRMVNEEDDDDEEEDEDDVDILEKVMFPEEMVPPLQYDYGMIADKLFDLASEKTIPPRNRKPIYKMVKRFQSLAKGVYPMPDLLKQIREEKDNEYLKDELPWWKKLQEKEKKKKRRKRRRGKKSKKDQEGIDDGEDHEEDDDDDEGEEMEEDVVPKKKMKIQKEDVDKTDTANKKKKRKQKMLTETHENPEKDSNNKDSNEQRTHVDNEFTELKAVPTKGRKSKVKKSQGDNEGLLEENAQSQIPLVEESISMEPGLGPDGTSKRKKKKKKREEASKTDGENSSFLTEPKSNTESDSDLGETKSRSQTVEAAADDFVSPTEGTALSTSRTPKSKSIKKGKKKSARAANDDASGMDFNTVVDDASIGSRVESPQAHEGMSKPFAAFQKVSTPVAYVKKSKVSSEPSTLPKAKAQSRVETQFSPPMTRKRVKIALSKNQFQAANDYKQRIKLSPGVPFDGSKKPAFSVLKQTPPRSEVKNQKVRGSTRKSGKAEKKRARATNF